MARCDGVAALSAGPVLADAAASAMAARMGGMISMEAGIDL